MQRFTSARHAGKSLPALFMIMLLVLGMSATSVFAIGEATATPEPGQAQPTNTPQADTPAATPSDTDTTERSIDESIDLAITQIQNGDTEAAIDTLNGVLQQEPENLTALIFRGQAYSARQQYIRAIDDFSRAIDLYPYDWSFYFYRGQAYEDARQYPDALQDYNQSIKQNPLISAPYVGRSNIQFQQGNTSQALVASTIADSLSASANGDDDGANELLEEAIERDGGETYMSAAAYYILGINQLGSGDDDDAIDSFTAALEVAPEMDDSYLGRGSAYINLGDVPAAASDFHERILLAEIDTQTDSIEAGVAQTLPMSRGQVYLLTFEAEAGDVISITANDNDAGDEIPVDALIVLLDPSETPISGDDDGGGELDSLISELTLSDAGTYTLVLSHANGGWDGDITVTLEK